jgi:hypothetical protein
MYATFNRFEIELTEEQALSGSHPGPCDEDVKELLNVPAIASQLDKIGQDAIKAELREYGAWDEIELSDVEQNRARILWIACGDVREELRR